MATNKREYYKENRDRILTYQKERQRSGWKRVGAYQRKYRTGFTQEDWDTRFVAQMGLCAICRDKKATDADHNHSTKQKRALLCRRCNLVVGLFENKELNEKILSYLKYWDSQEER